MRIGSPLQFGGVVRTERKNRGLTQAQLAAAGGVSRAWLARFETGHPAASLEQTFRVLRALDLDLSLIERRYSPEEAAVLAAFEEREQRPLIPARRSKSRGRGRHDLTP